MPPKGRGTTKDLVRVGPKSVSGGNGLVRKNDLRPTTERALILRNGKQGARGTGELMLVKKLIGREKLDLLAGKDLLIFIFLLAG